MHDCQACLQKCHRLLYAQTLTIACLRRPTSNQLPRWAPGRIAAAWPRWSTTALATRPERDPPTPTPPALILTADSLNESKDPKRYALQQEMRYLGDPLKLAANTVTLLKKDQDEKAGDLVRMASKSMPCTVSWNHMIDYEMSKGRVTRAMATYNDVRP